MEVEGLFKRFPRRRSLGELLGRRPRQGDVHALAGVSLGVSAGSCFGILGPNGAGKSTLFRILSTLVLPDSGRATVSGLDVVEDDAAVRELISAAGADERSLFWRLSAAENLRLYASLHGLRGRERSARVEEVLAVVGLEGTGGRMVGTFSSGLRQRLLLARSLLPRPRVLLLDEPTRSLDPVAARAFRSFLREEIVERQGCTVLLATHGADEAFGLCDQVAVLHRGRVVAGGRAADLAATVRDDRVVVWTSRPGSPVFDRPELLGGAVERLPEGEAAAAAAAGATPAADRWSPVLLRVPGGPDGSAALLTRLNAAGVPVSALEVVRPTLAELLERLTVGEEDGRAAGTAAAVSASGGGHG